MEATPSYYERDEGQSVSMACNYTVMTSSIYAPDIVDLVWRNYLGAVKDGSYSLLDPALTLESVQPGDLGVYYCVLRATQETYSSRPVSLIVNCEFSPFCFLFHSLFLCYRMFHSVMRMVCFYILKIRVFLFHDFERIKFTFEYLYPYS